MLHLIARANGSLRLFRRYADFLTFARCLAPWREEFQIVIYHYAFLHTHVHLLVRASQPERLATAIKSCTLSYFHYYHRKYQYTGHLWHGRYRSILIANEPHFLQAGRYI